MECPRCGNKWDGTRVSCPQCGFRNDVFNPAERPVRSPSSSLRQAPVPPTSRPGSGTLSFGGSPLPKAPRLAPFPAPSAEKATLPPQAFAPSQAAQEAFDGVAFLTQKTQPLAVGTLLGNGRYRLHELQESQTWLDGIFEATWRAQDMLQGGMAVSIRELAFLDISTEGVKSILRNATTALLAIGRHPRVPALRDAFNDQGRSFFVFEYIEGESMLARMQTRGRPLDEQEVIEICLQISEILELQAEQVPPLVHGLLNPGHILAGRAGSQYLLTNFSILLAGNAPQFVAGTNRAHLSPYIAPELIYGTIDGRLDLYSLIATAYYLVTGSMPRRVNAIIPPARRINANVSTEFEAFLLKGLLQLPNQRYQQPADIRQALLALRSNRSALSRSSGQLWGEQAPQMFVPLSLQSQGLPENILQEQARLSSVLDGEEEHRRLLPRPEDLPPLPGGYDMLQAFLWLFGILVTMLAVIIVARGSF